MSKAVDIFDGILLVRTRHYDEVKKVVVLQGNKPEKRFFETRPRGEWLEKEDYVGDTYYDCSVCGNSWSTVDGTPWNNGMNFCPNCGSSMTFDLCSYCKFGDDCERSDKGISFAKHITCWKFER